MLPNPNQSRYEGQTIYNQQEVYAGSRGNSNTQTPHNLDIKYFCSSKHTWSESQNRNKKTHGSLSKHIKGSLLFVNHEIHLVIARCCIFN